MKALAGGGRSARAARRRVADFVSFYPKQVTITIDADRLEEAPGQNVIAHGPDRNLSVDEVGSIQLVEHLVAAEV